MNFIEAAKNSAEAYIQWLEAYNTRYPNFPKGHLEIAAQYYGIGSAPDCYTLRLFHGLKASGLESLRIKINGLIYEHSEIEPILFNEYAKLLTIKLSGIPAEVLNDAEITLVVDLIYLIKRIGDWYNTFGGYICFPPAPNSSDNKLPVLSDVPSAQQQAAVEMALSKPLSYVWGAPGTGKTHFVLARCVLTYVLQNKKILIVAPTNNAVDQMLFGILDVLKEADVPLDCVFRLGFPTEALKSKYPEICVRSSVDAEYSDIKARLKAAKKAIRLRTASNDFFENAGAMLSILQQLKADYERDDLRKKYIQDISVLEISKEEEKANLQLYEKRLENFDRLFGAKLFIFTKILAPQKEFRLRNERADVLFRIEQIKRELKEIDLETASLQERIISVPTAEVTPSELAAWIISIMECDAILKNHLISRTELSPAAIDATYVKLNEVVELTYDRIQQANEDHHEFDKMSDEELYTYILDNEENLKHFSGKTTEDHLKSCLVCAATIDACVSKIHPDGVAFAHVFMDEAGYCSLIRGAILLGYAAPLTLFGDHMQLPPICEIDDEALRRDDNLKYVPLWSQSVLYIESVFTDLPKAICEDYFKGVGPQFSLLEKLELTKTYRFGSSLANVLAGYVYSSNFCGNPDVETNIYFCNAVPREGDKSRQSFSEIEQLKLLAARMKSKDIAILTPYRKQCQLLNKAFPELRKNEQILTVHGSQGREWDTVILSVVDSRQQTPWFTNSLNEVSKGKLVMNTALSRVKKNLILVCDVEYWKLHESQLICKLLSVSKIMQ